MPILYVVKKVQGCSGLSYDLNFNIKMLKHSSQIGVWPSMSFKKNPR